jgi:branched-chain amino acid transport system permease protein
VLIQQIVNGLLVGSVYALFALGLTLIFGVMGILNLAHAAIFMWGALIAFYGVTQFGMPLALAFLIAMIAGGLLSVALDFLVYRPLRKRNADQFAALFASIGANLVLMSIGQQLTNSRITSFPFGTFPVQFFEIFGLRLSLMQISMAAITALMVSLLVWYIYVSKFGKQVRAVAIDEKTASLLGVNPNLTYLATFFLAGVLAGAGGAIIGLAFNSVHFMMGEPMLLRAFVIVILGGLGSVKGAVVAAIGIGVVQALTTTYVSSQLSDVIIFSLLFVMLLIYPTGLFMGLRQPSRVSRQ